MIIIPGFEGAIHLTTCLRGVSKHYGNTQLVVIIGIKVINGDSNENPMNNCTLTASSIYCTDKGWSAVAENIWRRGGGGDRRSFHSAGVFDFSPFLQIIANMQFTYHGPDADIRQLRLHSSGASLANIYDPYSGKVVVGVFNPHSYMSHTMYLLWLW